MGKKAVLAILGLSIICNITACKPAYKEANKDTEANKGEKTEIDVTSLEDINWSAKHLNCQLSERVAIDADIVPDSIWKSKFGLYHYTLYDNKDEPVDLERTEQLAEVLDQYYGRDVTLVEKDITDELHQIENVAVRNEPPQVSFSMNDTWHSSLISYNLETYCPVKITGYDEAAIDSKVKELQELLYEYTGIHECPYDVYWFGEDMYAKLADIEKKYGIISVLSDEAIQKQEEFYEIIVRPKLDYDISVQRLPNISFQSLNGENDSEFIVKDNLGKDVPYMGDYNMGIILDKEYNMVLLHSRKMFDIEDKPFDHIEIYGLDEILQKFMKQNKRLNTTILDVSMYYSASLSGELDEENNRDVYMAPYWVITYYSVGKTGNSQYIYSAVTGELVYNID